MAQLPPHYHNIHKPLQSKLSWKCKGTTPHIIPLDAKQSCTLVGGKRLLVKCCSSSSSSPLAAEKLDGNDEKEKFDYVVSEYGWKIRRMIETEDEMKEIANIQAQAFHEPVFLFNDMFFEFFQAEVLAGLVYRLRNSAPDRYACLVAEPLPDNPGVKQELVGVVDLTVYRDADVVKHLSGANEYLYVSGIAVLNKFRRQKVATALLKACDMMALQWGYEYVVLRAYEDDLSARRLYTNAGYKVVSSDPPWVTLIGRRRRVLMLKNHFIQ